jgi:hypothetical protein
MDPSWRKDEIAALKAETGLTGYVPKEGENLAGRDDLKMYCVWFPEEMIDPDFSPDNGFWGTMHYYAENGKDKEGLAEIRDPQPYYGGRMGPYFMYGQMYVPDHLHPLAIGIAIEQTGRQLGLISRVIEDAMKNYKRFLLDGSPGKNVGMLLKNVAHGGVVKAKGFQKQMAEEFTIGGIDNNMLAMYQFMTEMMDKRQTVIGKGRKPARLHEFNHPAHDEHCGQKRGNKTDGNQFHPIRRNQMPVFIEIKYASAEQCRQRQEKRKFGSSLAIKPRKQSADNRGARTRYAWNNRNRLKQANQQRFLGAYFFNRFDVFRVILPIDPQQHKPTQNQRPSNHNRLIQMFFDIAMQRNTDKSRRQKRHE